jgi:hypothetical protein
MKKVATVIVAILIMVFALSAQTTTTAPTTTPTAAVPAATNAATPSLTLPTYVLAGASFNQIGTPRVNLIAGAIYPSGSSTVEYLATIINIVPHKSINSATGKSYFSFTTTAQQSVHKIVYKSGKFVLLVGGGAGVAFTQASPTGTNAGFAGSFTATPVYQPAPKFGIAFPIQGLYTASGWNLVPTVAVVFRP